MYMIPFRANRELSYLCPVKLSLICAMDTLRITVATKTVEKCRSFQVAGIFIVARTPALILSHAVIILQLNSAHQPRQLSLSSASPFTITH